jgi:hypothetical protein
MVKKPDLSPEWEEEVNVSPRNLELKKKQVEFEKKKASGEFDLEIKEPSKLREYHFLKWLTIGLVAAGLVLLVLLFDIL